MKNLTLVRCAGLAGSAVGLLAASARAGNATYNSVVNSNSPLVFLGLDETSGSTAADLSGNGNVGAYQTSATLGQPSFGPNMLTSVHGNGSKGVVTVAQTIDPMTGGNFDAIGTGNFTIDFWFNTSSITGREDLFTFKGGSSDFGVHLGSQANGELGLYHNGFIVNASSSTTVTANAWHNLAVVRSSGNDTFYLDGSVIGTGVDTGSMNTGGSPLILGSNNGNNLGESATTGNFDELALYTKALSQGDIQNLLTAAPEPGSLALLSLAGGGLLARRRRGA